MVKWGLCTWFKCQICYGCMNDSEQKIADVFYYALSPKLQMLAR